MNLIYDKENDCYYTKEPGNWEGSYVPEVDYRSVIKRLENVVGSATTNRYLEEVYKNNSDCKKSVDYWIETNHVNGIPLGVAYWFYSGNFANKFNEKIGDLNSEIKNLKIQLAEKNKQQPSKIAKAMVDKTKASNTKYVSYDDMMMYGPKSTKG